MPDTAAEASLRCAGRATRKTLCCWPLMACNLPSALLLLVPLCSSPSAPPPLLVLTCKGASTGASLPPLLVDCHHWLLSMLQKLFPSIPSAPLCSPGLPWDDPLDQC